MVFGEDRGLRVDWYVFDVVNLSFVEWFINEFDVVILVVEKVVLEVLNEFEFMFYEECLRIYVCFVNLLKMISFCVVRSEYIGRFV